MAKTRSVTECPIFGPPADLSESLLPTWYDVIKCFLWVRHKLEGSGINRNSLVSEALEIVAKKVEAIWNKATIPVLSHQRIVALLRDYQKKRKDVLKPFKTRQKVASYKTKLETFLSDSQKLFDIATCKCTNINLCSCLKQYKVSVTCCYSIIHI